MTFLIVKAGIADHLFAAPIQSADRFWLVPGFDFLDMDHELSKLERPSPSVRSLLTTPLFLMGGAAAVRIRQGVPGGMPRLRSPVRLGEPGGCWRPMARSSGQATRRLPWG